MTENINNQLEYNFSPRWEELEIIRQYISEFSKNNSLSRDDTDSLVMVSSELVENALKYGDFDRLNKVEFSAQIKNHKVILEVKNPINSLSSEMLRNLDSNIQWIRGYQNPYEAYIERLKLISGKELKIGESGLGLVRIAYEGKSIIDFYVNEDNILSVSAVFQF
jgi:hypothetical protein